MKRPVEFGDYYLFERIAVGGMAEVFKAATYGVEGFERIVALKRVLPQVAQDQTFIDMFVDEAKIAVQLDHPNIGRIFDLGTADDAYFIAMEYVSGHDVRAVFDRLNETKKALSIEMACHIVKEVCEALEYAHTKTNNMGEPLSLIHRDVSPQNILVGYDGQVKLIDFGIAKAAGKATKTKSGILKGKFGYMSPEHVRGRPIDRRSDLFALAVVLYELLTLERCFQGSDDFSTLEKVRQVEFAPVRSVNRAVPPELERIVHKGLAKSPRSRFQSAAEFHEALQTFLYQIGSFVSRKHLSSFVSDLFADEQTQKRLKLNAFRTYAAEHIPAAQQDSSLDDLIVGRTVKLAPTEKLLPPPDLPLPDVRSDVSDRETEDILGRDKQPAVEAKPTVRVAPSMPAFAQEQRTRERSPDKLVGVLGFGVAVIALMVIYVSMGQNVQTPGQIAISTSPAEVSVFVDSVKTFEGTTPITFKNIAPNQPYDLNILADGFQPFQTQVVVEPGQTFDLEAALVPEEARTTLKLLSIPSGAKVFLDEQLVGTTPLDFFRVKPGPHELIYVRDGVEVHTEQFSLKRGESKTYEVLLPPASVDVTVQAKPLEQARVFVRNPSGEEVFKGQGRVSFQVPNDGKHELIVRADGYDSKVHMIRSSKEQMQFNFALARKRKRTIWRKRNISSLSPKKNIGSTNPQPGATTLESSKTTPSSEMRWIPKERNQASSAVEPAVLNGQVSVLSFPSASVFVDGRLLGETPIYKAEVPIGGHAIMIQRERDPAFQKVWSIRVRQGQEERIRYRHPSTTNR